MTFTLELENYQGPFDVLLELLNRRQLDIAELSLAKITDDYLDYISELELELGEMNWFLFVATKLTYDKSQTVLAIQIDDEEADLTESLRQYSIVKQLATVLSRSARSPQHARPGQKRGGPAMLCSQQELAAAYRSALNQFSDLPSTRLIKTQSDQLNQMRKNFITHINKLKQFSDIEIISGAKSRKEAVVYLLTLLELLRHGQLQIKNNSFSISGAV